MKMSSVMGRGLVYSGLDAVDPLGEERSTGMRTPPRIRPLCPIKVLPLWVVAVVPASASGGHEYAVGFFGLSGMRPFLFSLHALQVTSGAGAPPLLRPPRVAGLGFDLAHLAGDQAAGAHW